MLHKVHLILHLHITDYFSVTQTEVKCWFRYYPQPTIKRSNPQRGRMMGRSRNPLRASDRSFSSYIYRMRRSDLSAQYTFPPHMPMTTVLCFVRRSWKVWNQSLTSYSNWLSANPEDNARYLPVFILVKTPAPGESSDQNVLSSSFRCTFIFRGMQSK